MARRAKRKRSDRPQTRSKRKANSSLLWSVVYVINDQEKRAQVAGDDQTEAMDAFRATHGLAARIKTMTALVAS